MTDLFKKNMQKALELWKMQQTNFSQRHVFFCTTLFMCTHVMFLDSAGMVGSMAPLELPRQVSGGILQSHSCSRSHWITWIT